MFAAVARRDILEDLDGVSRVGLFRNAEALQERAVFGELRPELVAETTKRMPSPIHLRRSHIGPGLDDEQAPLPPKSVERGRRSVLVQEDPHVFADWLAAFGAQQKMVDYLSDAGFGFNPQPTEKVSV